MRQVAVIGGGIAGLTAARYLQGQAPPTGSGQADLRVVLFESGSRLGGTIETETQDGFVLEKGPDSFLSEKPWALELSKELGLKTQLIGTRNENRKSFIVRRGRLVAVPEGFYLISPTQFGPFLNSPLFSPLGKIRMGLETLVPRSKTGSDESIGSFIRRRFGREALERAGQPMLAGIYTGDPEQLSLMATMPRFKALENEHGSVIRGLLAGVSEKKTALAQASGPRYSLFLSYKEGMETLTRALGLTLPAGSVRLGSPVRQLIYDASAEQWRLTTQSGQTQVFDAVCSSLSARASAAVLKDAAPALSEKLNSITYESVATVNFAYDRADIAHPLDGFGFVVPATEKRSLVACTFCDRKFEGRAPEGKTLLRAFVGGAFGREFYSRDDKDLTAAVEKDLAELLGIRAKPLSASLSRYPDAMVQYRVGHLELASQIETETRQFKGLYLTGSSYRGVGIPDCVRDAQLTTEKINKEIR